MTTHPDRKALSAMADELELMADSVQAISPARKERRLREWAARLRALAAPASPDLLSAVDAVLNHVEGALPVSGWLRDNDASRAALDALRKARAASPVEGDVERLLAPECRICPNDMLHAGPCDYSPASPAEGEDLLPGAWIKASEFADGDDPRMGWAAGHAGGPYGRRYTNQIQASTAAHFGWEYWSPAPPLAARLTASPAGGGDALVCPDCGDPALLYSCVACSHTNYPAPEAGGGGES